MKTPKIVLEIKGGTVQHIASTQYIDVVIIDYDQKDEIKDCEIIYREPDQLFDDFEQYSNDNDIYDQFKEAGIL